MLNINSPLAAVTGNDDTEWEELIVDTGFSVTLRCRKKKLSGSVGLLELVGL